MPRYALDQTKSNGLHSLLKLFCAIVSDFHLDARHPIPKENLDVLLDKITINSEQRFMDGEISSLSEALGDCKSPDVAMENENKDAKHKNQDAKHKKKRGKTAPKNQTNQFLSTPSRIPSIAPRIIHQLSNCTQYKKKKFPCYQCSKKFGFKSCRKHHLRIHSCNIALWQNDYLTEETLSTQLRYWKDKLIGYETLNLLPDYPRPNKKKLCGQDIYFELNENISINLRNLASELKISLYTVLLSGYYLMLRIYSNQDDIVIGTLIANRQYSRIKKEIRIIVNTLVIRIHIHSTYLLKDFIRHVDGDITTSQRHQNLLPFEKFLEEISISRHPIFQVMFGLQNVKTNLQSQTDEETTAAKFDLTTVIDDSGGVLKGVFNYATTSYREETIHRFIETYVHILSQLSTLTNAKNQQELTTVADLSYVSAKQYHQIIYTWNASDKKYPDKTINQLFEEQVAETPHNIAIVYKEVHLTYKELNERTNQLALFLIEEYSVKPDTLITLCLDRSEHMIIAILAVLKSGGAYVPIDPSYPDERIQYILHDTSTSLLLTNELHLERLKGISYSGSTNRECLLPRQQVNILSIDCRKFQDKLSLQGVTNPNTKTTSSHLAYVIYTSGTTGKPKGVMVEHRGLVNLNRALINKYALGDAKASEVILQFSNYVFDASVEQILLGLLNGYALLLIPNQLWLNKEMFINYLVVNKVTHIDATPKFLEQHNFSKILSLKRLVSGGEVLSKESYSKIRLNNKVNIINVYGLTETSVSSSVNVIRWENINIGSPIYNTRCYVLTDNLVPVPVRAIGELYIGGAGLARGYLNRQDLTAKRFITNPFQTKEEIKSEKNTRLYKTGDLVRWLPDGNLEYIGRKDLQVKIRGYRIELGEIESALLGYKGIEQCVALAREHKNVASESSGYKYMVGYYVSDNRLDEEAILRYLGSKLPDFMVPTILVRLKTLPLTINGKIDRKALPDPEYNTQDNYVAPRNETEAKACRIWAEVLGLNADKVGTHDDFFRLGGDSIISIQLVSRLRKKLQLNVSVKDIFSYKSIASLCENVSRNELDIDNVSSLQTEQGILAGAVSLLPIQNWFFWCNFSVAQHWNQSFLIKTPTLDFVKLQGSIDKLVQHHDCFRVRYIKNYRCNTYEQYYDGRATLEPVTLFDISTLGYKENSQAFKINLQELLTKWQANFDLTHGPMYCVGYIYGYQDGSARIYFALHHLIVDAVSWRILSEDLRDIYNGKILGSKGSSYRQWVKIVKDYSSEHQEELHYWNNVLADYDSSRINNLMVSESTAHISSIELCRDYTSLLLQESNQTYYTQINDLLLTALGYSLAEITGSNINHIILEGHGREEINSSVDMTRTLGWFTSIFPVRLEVDHALGTSIKCIKESLRTMPHKGLGFGPILGYNSKALPRVNFNYLGQFGQEISENLKDTDIWRIVGEDSGISESPNNWDSNVINFTGLMVNSRLEFIIVSKLNKNATKNLAGIFKSKLEIVINHTINQKRNCLTPCDINYIVNKERLDALQELREIETMFLANSLQQGFIYHAISQGDVDDAYIVQQFWQYHCPININNLKEAWRYAQDKFSSLRLRFDWQEELLQIIDKEGSLDWRYINLSDEFNLDEQENIVKDIREKDRLERYDLAQGNLFRIYLIKQKWDLYSCIFSNHHAILDGWSMPILMGNIHDTYVRLTRNELMFLQPEYVYKTAQRYIQEHREIDKDYWAKYIAQVDERSDLSGLLLRSDKRISEYKHILNPTDEKLAITRKLYIGLKLLSQQEGVTLNAMLQYVWHKVIHVYGNGKQTIVGTIVAGRSLPVDDIEKSVGLYIKTLPLIVNHEGSKRLIDSIKDIQSSISELNGKSSVNLSKLQVAAERLFDSIFAYENWPSPKSEAQDEVKFKYKGTVEKLDYPLNVTAYEANNELIFQLQYAGELFSKDTINRMLYLTRTILEQLPSRIHQAVTNLNYLSAQQYDQIIHRWNATDKEYPANKTIHQLFEEQVAKTPDSVATIYNEVKLTYRELNEMSNKLAVYLLEEYSIEPDNLIALCLDRSEHMLIAILAVLKSGGAYVPIDPSYPDERIQYILHDTSTSLLLTNELHQERLVGISCLGDENQEFLLARQQLNILSVDNQEFQDKLSLQAVTNPNTKTTSSHLAYVIYTSGTTGQPKGVMVEHRGLVNLNGALINRYGIGDSNDREVILQFSNYVFDASVDQIIIALLNGHVLLLIPNQLWLNEENFIDYLFVNKVTHINATPTFLQQHKFSKLINLKRLVFSGEFLSRQSCEKVRKNDSCNIINGYGPTETSVTSIVKFVRKWDVNIGSPIYNTRCYVLTDNLVPVPVGVIGELYIGGAGLSRGYLNRPDLTAERFVANPFQIEEEKRLGKNTRLYKTGDLVRWLPNGNLEYIGRNDLQVKVRGYRIELGEIESALLGYMGIKQCVALAKEHSSIANELSGNKYLVGYYVSDDKLDAKEILHYLGSKLPDYMVPAILIHVDKFPLTISGKLDTKSLPDPEFISQGNYVAPRNEIEEKVRQIWAEVLGLNADKVGIHDNFFTLGGDSIISIQLVSRLRKRLELNISVKDIFSHKSIARLYEHIFRKQLGTNNVSRVRSEQGILVGTVPLLPIQEWFFWCNYSAAHHWNQSFIIKTPRLNLCKLQNSIDKLVQNHDCFRLKYKIDNRSHSYEQYYDGCAKLEPVTVFDISTLVYKKNSEAYKTNLHELLTNWQANFNLTDGPMYNVAYIYGYEDGSARIHFALHHLIVDAVSWRIVSEDLRDLYYGKMLGSKGSSYRQWANIVNDYPSKHPAEQSYWNNILSDYDSSRLNNLLVSESTAHYTSIELSLEYTTLLLQACNLAYHTQINDLLLTALGYSLSEITKCTVNHIILEGHGREVIDSNIDITGTLGWFTTIYPVRVEIADALGTCIRSTKESLRMIPYKGVGFGPLLGYKSHALPRVSFNYLGQFGQENCENLKEKYNWRISGEDSGISISPNNWDTNLININGLIVDGRLQFSIHSKLNEKTTEYLARIFQQKQEVIINHTINQPKSYLTPSDLDHILSKERVETLQESREIEAIYLANNLQQGFIYHALSQGNVDDAYLVQVIWQYCCPINIKNLKKAWRYAQDKFSSLRLRFDWQENLVQIIDKEGSFDWRYIDLSDELNLDKQENIVKDIREKDRLERYDLAHGSLFRIYLIKQKWDLYSCIFSNHHAILDGWSMPILLAYIHDTYLRLDRKELVFLQPDNAYEAAQRYIQEHQEDDKTFWDEYIAQVEERSNLSVLLLSSGKRLSEYKQIFHPTDKTLAISGNLYRSLKLLSQQEGVTLNAILQYVWHKVLHVYGNNKQTILGTIISGRSLPIDDLEKSVGLYINTLPLIVDHQASKHIIESIKDIQSSINEFNDRCNVSLAKLQSSAERLFDCLFIYENYPNPTSSAQDAVKLKFKGSVEKLDYPLSVAAHEVNHELIFQLEYAGELFSEDTINDLLHLTRTLLDQLPSRAHQEVSNLSFLNAQQYDKIIHSWNATDKEYPAHKTIHQLFEEQVAETPQNVALVYKEIQLTYRELNKRSNQLAIYLLENYNIKPDNLITLCFDRSEHMLIAILAVLKSGGAYVPIDPSYPDERIQFISEDTSTTLLLTNEIYQERLEGISCTRSANQGCLLAQQQLNILSIDSREFQDKLSLQDVTNPNTVTTSANLAYVIYTSGTTGKPKGVMLEHRGIVNLNSTLKNTYAICDSSYREVVLLFYSYVFDASVEPILLGLLNGYVLLLMPNQLWLNRENFINYLFVNKVTHIDATPTFLEQHNFSKLLSLKRIVCSGESLNKESYQKICPNDSIKIINEYGPTETSVTSIVKTLRKGDVTIGYPIFNTKCYVSADNLVLVPVGAIGELYIGGAGLARGYLNRPDLTAERFIANPFQTEIERKLGKNTRLYKTGDLVRWLPDGNLECIGRKDLQVKIRGYRIELGEIESALLGYKGIKQSVALACSNVTSELSCSKFLVGYYVSDDKLDEEAILQYLRSKLPDYMVPAILVHLNNLPLTINGKLDRNALLVPKFTSQDNHVAPRNEIEQKVCQIWAEVLGLNADIVGVNDDFFRLGGDSIISIQLVSRLQKKLQSNVSVKDIFSHKSIGRLCENILRKEPSADSVSSFQTEQGT